LLCHCFALGAAVQNVRRRVDDILAPNPDHSKVDITGEIVETRFEAEEARLKCMKAVTQIRLLSQALEDIHAGKEVVMGETVSLDQKGLAQVAAMKDDAEMEHFIKRVVWTHGGVVTSKEATAAFKSIVPWYSGNYTSKYSTFEKLTHSLEKAAWLENFSREPVTEDTVNLAF